MVPEMFKCPFCGKSFDDPYAYAEHIAICAKEKKERDRKAKEAEDLQKKNDEYKFIEEKTKELRHLKHLYKERWGEWPNIPVAAADDEKKDDKKAAKKDPKWKAPEDPSDKKWTGFRLEIPEIGCGVPNITELDGKDPLATFLNDIMQVLADVKSEDAD